MKVLLETTKGNITIELHPEKAPLSVAGFAQRVQAGFYNGLIFHRVIPGFMIQGGGFTWNGDALNDPKMVQKDGGAAIQNEARNGVKNERYAVALARTSAPHSATSQFFINVNDNGFLDYPGQDGWGYAVFGNVIDGKEVVDAIAQVKTTRMGMFADVPAEPVVINTATVLP